MNKGQNVRRGRTRHMPKKGGSNSNNGTGNRVDSKSRGNPKQNLEKYLGMAREARQAGDRVNEEYFLQFAEHFQRIINDRAQDSADKRERSGNTGNRNNNHGRNQQKDQTKEQVSKDDAEAVDPAKSKQPKVVEAKEAMPDFLTAEPVQVEDKPKPKPRPARKPRAKKADKPAEDSPKESAEQAPAASPELPLNKEGEAAE